MINKISGRRSYDFLPPRNTVFEDSSPNPIKFNLCKTTDLEYPYLIISDQKVNTFQCTKYDRQDWDAKYIGYCHAIFKEDQHYVGHRYNNGDVDFPTF
jgi:hypothetical protein